jgi:YVTN family beta-propeller protein
VRAFMNRMKTNLVILTATLSSLSLGALGPASSARPQEEFFLPAPPEQAEKLSNRTVQAQPAPDFETYRQRVEPIFLKQRPGHARCYSCHTLSNRVFHLEPLSPGATDWTAQQSQNNFQSALQLVVPGHPESSWLLLHPLAPEAGGHPFHSGGRQFESKDDPDWQTLFEWVRGTRTQDATVAASHSNARIYVTNSAGNTVDVIDPASNKVVQTIRGIELPHGVAFSPDGARVYISNESESVLDVVDRKRAKF